MKKIALACLGFALLSGTVNAQTEKNTLLLGGNVTFNSVESNSSFTASPNIGIFVINNLAIGVEAGLFTTDGFSSWNAGPFARYYFGQNKNGKPFAGAGLNIAGAKDSDTNVGFGAQAGYALFLNKSIALEFVARYNRAEQVDMIALGAGFQIHLGK